MSKEIKENQNNYTMIPRNLTGKIKIELLLFYSYAARFQCFKNETCEMDDSNFITVAELSRKLGLRYQTTKSYLEQLVEVCLASRSETTENTYQILFITSTSKVYEDGCIYDYNMEAHGTGILSGSGTLKQLRKGYTFKTEDSKECKAGYTEIPDTILFNKELSWNEKTWWAMCNIVVKQNEYNHKGYALGTFITMFGLSKSNNNFVYNKINNLMKKGYIISYKATNKGIKIELSETKSEAMPVVEHRKYNKVENEEVAMKMLEEVKSVEEQVEQETNEVKELSEEIITTKEIKPVEKSLNEEVVLDEEDIADDWDMVLKYYDFNDEIADDKVDNRTPEEEAKEENRKFYAATDEMRKIEKEKKEERKRNMQNLIQQKSNEPDFDEWVKALEI